MSKYLIFLLLIISTFSKRFIEQKKKNYLNDIFSLFSTALTNVKYNYESLFPLEEEEESMIYRDAKLKDQIGRADSFKFTKNDKFANHIFENELDAKNDIKNNYIEYIVENKKKKKFVEHLGIFFTKQISYNSQWSKYDILVSQSHHISSLSLFTKFESGYYFNVYFETKKRIKHQYNDFILINKSENKDNPFNNFYSMKIYKYEHNEDETDVKKLFKKISSKEEPNIHKYKEPLVKYFSILSFNAISKQINNNYYFLPFEEK